SSTRSGAMSPSRTRPSLSSSRHLIRVLPQSSSRIIIQPQSHFPAMQQHLAGGGLQTQGATRIDPHGLAGPAVVAGLDAYLAPLPQVVSVPCVNKGLEALAPELLQRGQQTPEKLPDQCIAIKRAALPGQQQRSPGLIDAPLSGHQHIDADPDD